MQLTYLPNNGTEKVCFSFMRLFLIKTWIILTVKVIFCRIIVPDDYSSLVFLGLDGMFGGLSHVRIVIFCFYKYPCYERRMIT